MYNVSWALVYKVNIDDETIFQVLSEINGVAPTDWFIAQNVGKDRKETFAYIVNNTPEYIQLIPLKGNKKNGLIDKGNIVTLNKATDIEKCILIMTDYCKIKLQSKDGTKFLLIAHIVGSTKHQRKSIKALRKEYKKSSRPSQMLWSTIIIIYLILCAILGWNLEDVIFPSQTGSELLQQQSQEEKEAIKEVEDEFNKNIGLIKSPEYKEVFSIKVKPYESNAVVTGKTKVVELNSFRFTVSANSEFHKFDSGDYGYVDGSNNNVISAGFVSVNDTNKETTDLLELYKHIQGGALEKMGYSMNSWYDIQKSTYSIDYFNADIQNFNFYEKMLFNLAVQEHMRDATEDRKLLEFYEKEFDSYYMIIKKVQYNDMAEEIVYSYEIDIYFKDDLNTFESYGITNIGYTEEECFAIINSMELIEE
ncbi:MAG: hypothetical protein IKB36_04915 [Clostridia bacterium]|nr:hypothetical protein [Clostridia bacterium]